MTIDHTTPAVILDRLLVSVAATLDGIEHRPGMYGGESLEFQALQAVELRQRILRPTMAELDPTETSDAWHAFSTFVIGEHRSVYLYAVLREEGMLDKLPGLLGDAARWIAREYPPEGKGRLAGAHDVRWSDMTSACRDCGMRTTFHRGKQLFRAADGPLQPAAPPCTWAATRRSASTEPCSSCGGTGWVGGGPDCLCPYCGGR